MMVGTERKCVRVKVVFGVPTEFYKELVVKYGESPKAGCTSVGTVQTSCFHAQLKAFMALSSLELCQLAFDHQAIGVI